MSKKGQWKSRNFMRYSGRAYSPPPHVPSRGDRLPHPTRPPPPRVPSRGDRLPRPPFSVRFRPFPSVFRPFPSVSVRFPSVSVHSSRTRRNPSEFVEFTRIFHFFRPCRRRKLGQGQNGQLIGPRGNAAQPQFDLKETGRRPCRSTSRGPRVPARGDKVRPAPPSSTVQRRHSPSTGLRAAPRPPSRGETVPSPRSLQP